jgi:anti-anti-sigma regulatory factor
MVDLAMLARRLRQREARLLLRSPQPQIWRLIQLVGLDKLPAIAVDDPASAAA